MSDNPNFKPGDIVVFPGINAGTKKIPSVEGKLYLNDKNKKPGVMMIKGDKLRMMFMSDGTIYCHPQYGCMLKIKEEDEETARKNQAAQTPKVKG